MNMPLSVLNRRRRIGAASTPAFSPSTLFASSEPGVWYDPSDLTTLFTDTAGTTPVTTPGQTVALMLDKSKGLTLGSERVADPTLTDQTGWVANADWVSISGGFEKTATTANSNLVYTLPAAAEVGKTYLVEVTINTAQTIDVYIGNASNGQITFTGNGTFRQYLSVVGSTGGLTGVVFRLTTAEVGSITYASVRELPGFHATQATAASRPTYGVVPLGGRRNLLTHSEQFDNAAWTKDGVTVAVASAPQEWYLANNGVATQSILSQAVSPSGDALFAIDLKADTIRYVRLRYTNVTNVNTVNLDLQTGASDGLPVTDVGGGFYRVYLAFTSGADNSGLINIYLSDTSGGGIVVPSSAKRIIMRKPQFELGSTATAYQRVSTAFDVTEAGVQSCAYLSFDGVDDFMLTGTITPGVDKAQVFAGVRKLSDGAYNSIVETSADPAANNGTIAVGASALLGGDRQTWVYQARGTANNFGGARVFAAPSTAVQTLLVDISQSTKETEIIGRLDGVQQSLTFSTSAIIGTGNFLAYPLYLGRRGGTTTPLNGNLYSLITRFGANLTTDQITNTETWVNARTGAYA